VIERAAILNDRELAPKDLGIRWSGRARGRPADSSAPSDRDQLESVLRECKWNKNAAAEKLGISYKTLLNKIHVTVLTDRFSSEARMPLSVSCGERCAPGESAPLRDRQRFLNPGDPRS